jgi:hypothetical protein
MALATHFIAIDVPLGNGDLVSAIEAALAQRGAPLRWAITQVEPTTQIATIEAVITNDTPNQAP